MNRKSPVLFNLESTLGPLEEQVMDCIWQRGTARVREVYEEIKEKKPLAYTTVMTVMDNLYKKGFVSRTKSGKSYLYRAAVGEQYIENTSIVRAISSLFPKKFIAYGAGLAISMVVLLYALFVLYEDIQYTGVVEFVRLFASEPLLAGSALWESLPLVSIGVFVFLVLIIGYLVRQIMTYRTRRLAV